MNAEWQRQIAAAAHAVMSEIAPAFQALQAQNTELLRLRGLAALAGGPELPLPFPIEFLGIWAAQIVQGEAAMAAGKQSR